MSTVASQGYILEYVGKWHHLADVRGYAYQHRLVAEVKIGRKLRKGEIVHHIDGNKQNNSPHNLEVKKSIAHHLFEHRKKSSNRRFPEEPNPTIKCKCGCGSKFKKYDYNNRPRLYVSGHNPQNDTTRKRVIEAIQNGKHTINEICELLSDLSIASIRTCLYKSVISGHIKRISRGVYSIDGIQHLNFPEL